MDYGCTCRKDGKPGSEPQFVSTMKSVPVPEEPCGGEVSHVDLSFYRCGACGNAHVAIDGQ